MISNNAPDQVSEKGIVPSTGVLLEGLEKIYSSRGKLSEFGSEKAVYGQLLPKVNQELEPGYLEKAVGLGSTATVWIVVDALKQRRALKLPRPRLGKLKDIVRVIRAEGERLATLSHQNVIRIYNSYEAPLTIDGDEYSFPFYTMEYLEGVKDFSEFVRDAPETLTGRMLISYFRDAMNGVAFLHANDVVHCDIKPGNILIAHGGRRALIADLGFAKHIPRQRPSPLGFTEVKHTPDYAHPELHKNVVDASDSGGNVATIARDKLHPRFDLYAFGRSMQEILVTIRDNEQTDPNRQFGHQSSLSSYQWLYLTYIAKRLLDGIVQKHDDDELKSDEILGLPDSVMDEIHYTQADEALEDFEKLLQFYNLEGEVPELNPNISTYIQIPHCHVPLTDRVQQIISHPTFMRLAQITQLGFISVVYPGATHTRFEHVLGTFAHCCEYIRALWYDEENCLFQCVMSKGDLELALVASLLHDIAQYPMAHDLTEIASEFAHEPYTRQVLETVPPTAGESLADVVKFRWGIGIESLLSVLNAGRSSPFRHRLLSSLINGPLDCDKLDYVRRDSTHLGVLFGVAIDHQRFIRNLTTIYQTRPETIPGPAVPRVVRKLELAEIGVAEKALVVAQSIWRTRKAMFSQVYWQHTARALKAMLGYVVRGILIATKAKGRDEEGAFWDRLRELVLFPTPSLESQAPAELGQMPSISMPSDVEATLTSDAEDYPPSSCLSSTDDRVLHFLWNLAPSDAEKQMIAAMRGRRLYLRLAVLSHSREADSYEVIYSQFRSHRSRGDHGAIEQARKKAQEKILQLAQGALKRDNKLVPVGSSVEDVVKEMARARPLILLDVPIKDIPSGGLGVKKENAIGYLPEDLSGVHSRKNPSFLGFSFSRADLDDSDFDRDVGKIRVFAHPHWRDLLARCLTDTQILGAVKDGFLLGASSS